MNVTVPAPGTSVAVLAGAVGNDAVGVKLENEGVCVGTAKVATPVSGINCRRYSWLLSSEETWEVFVVAGAEFDITFLAPEVSVLVLIELVEFPPGPDDSSPSQSPPLSEESTAVEFPFGKEDSVESS